MKNTITLLVAVLLIACVLPSCGATLIKRQHGPGYYINKNPGFPTAQSDRSDNKHIKPSTTKAENPSEETDVPSEEQIALTNPSNVPVTPVVMNDSPNTSSEKSEVKNAPPTSVANAEIKPVKPSLVEWASNTRLAQKMDFGSADKQSSSAPHEGDGLSLFGIVILILLILWLVGAISGGWGLGGLIHILLIIALILLILWLLRII